MGHGKSSAVRGNKERKEVVSKIIQKPHHVVISSTGTRVLMT